MLTVLTQNPFNLHVLTREIRRSLIPHDCRWSLARAVRALTKAKQDQPALTSRHQLPYAVMHEDNPNP